MSSCPRSMPFIINSNICYTDAECLNIGQFMDHIAGNTGNSYIAYALFRILFGKIVKLPEIKNLWSWDFAQEDKLVEQINTKHSHVLFCLQDQIRLSLSYGYQPDWVRINRFLKRLKKPFVVVSLGANAFDKDAADWYTRLSADFMEFLHILADHSISMGVRGEETQHILKKLGIGNAQPVGCPSFFETGPTRMIVKRELVPTDRCLGPDGYVLQDEQNLIEVRYFDGIQKLDANRYTPGDLCRYILGGNPCFASMSAWKTFVSSFAFSCASRMHGGILALNAGVPAVITNTDLRAREMCRLFHIPQRTDLQSNDEIDWRRVYEETNYDELNKQYPFLYSQFMQWLAEQGIGPKEIAQFHQWACEQPDLPEPVLKVNPVFEKQVLAHLDTHQYRVPSKVLWRKLLGKRILPCLRKIGFHC